MLPAYYANEYRRYQTYCRNYGDHTLYRIACGPELRPIPRGPMSLMKMAHGKMDALTHALLHRAHRRMWRDKGSATDFDEAPCITKPCMQSAADGWDDQGIISP